MQILTASTSLVSASPESLTSRCARLILAADVSNPASYEDLVELLVPELQKRGLMWEDYAAPGGTYRENLLGTPGHPGVPEGHPANRFKYEALKEKYGDENGDITIDRRTPATAANGEKTEEKTVLPIIEKPIVNGKTNGVTVEEKPVAVEATA